MKLIKGNEKGTRIVKRLLAAVCTAALVLGLMPVNLGVTSVQAYDKIDETTADCILSVDDQTTNITTNIDMYYEISTDPDDPYEGYVYVSDKNYTITFTAKSGTFNEDDITIAEPYSDHLTIVSKTLSNDKKTYTFIVKFAGDSSIEISGSPTGTEAPTKTATTTTLSAASITVTEGETWTLTAQAKAGSTDVAGATVVYYSDEDCKTKLEAAPTAVGTYYARGEYAGNDSYEASNSAAITVTIKEKTPEKGEDYNYTMAELLGKETAKLAAGTKIYLDKPIAYETRFGGTYEYGVGYGMLTDDSTKIKNYDTYVEQAGCIKDASDEVSAGTIITLDDSYVFNYYNDDGDSVEATITGKEWYFVVMEIGDDDYGFFIMPTSPTEGYIKEVTAPTISDDGQPVNASVKVGETAKFTVTATGDDLTYQWQIDKNDGNGFVNIDGATAASYTTAEVGASCNGYKYHCVVKNSAGSVATNDVTLTVTSDEPEEHKHTLVHHDAVAATTTASGTKEYWQCSDCKKYFSDAEGKNEISAPEVIDKLTPSDSGSSDSGDTSSSDSSSESTSTTTSTTTAATATESTAATTVSSANIAEVGTGTLSVEAAIDTTAPAAVIATPASDILSILGLDGTLTVDEVNGIIAGNIDVEVILGVTNSESTMTQTSRDLIKEKADAEGMTIAEYMDITLTKYVIPAGQSRESVTGTRIEKLTSGSVAITVTIPEAFKNTDAAVTRTYYVLRNHDGEVSVLNGTLSTDAAEFTFVTDKFSDYVLTYKDTAVSTATDTAAATTVATAPKTGDTTPVIWLFVLLLGSMAGLARLNRKRF